MHKLISGPLLKIGMGKDLPVYALLLVQHSSSRGSSSNITTSRNCNCNCNGTRNNKNKNEDDSAP